MPVRRNDHQSQLSATPFSRTMLVTRFGVSVEKVVATIETPISHQGADRPDVKNSAVLRPARRARNTAGRNDTTIDATTMTQSKDVTRLQSTSGGLANPAERLECSSQRRATDMKQLIRRLVLSVIFLAGVFATISATTRTMHLTANMKEGKPLEFDGRHTVIWEDRGGKWLIVHEHFSAPLPE